MILPAQYRITAPASDPAVAAMSIPCRFSSVCSVRNPPNDSTASDGIGGKIFSIIISRNIPKYPYSDKSSSKCNSIFLSPCSHGYMTLYRFFFYFMRCPARFVISNRKRPPQDWGSFSLRRFFQFTLYYFADPLFFTITAPAITTTAAPITIRSVTVGALSPVLTTSAPDCL